MTITTSALTALAEAQRQVDNAAEGVERAARPASEAGDSLNLSSEAVKLLAAKTSFDAALELAETADEIAQHTIDLLG